MPGGSTIGRANLVYCRYEERQLRRDGYICAKRLNQLINVDPAVLLRPVEMMVTCCPARPREDLYRETRELGHRCTDERSNF